MSTHVLTVIRRCELWLSSLLSPTSIQVCDTCKDAHNDILKREISRVNNQIKRGMNRIDDALSQVERNQQQLKTNADTVS